MIESVLIVEDIAQTRTWLKQIVTAVYPDAVIHEAGTVSGAIKLCAQNRIDLALVDLGLPDGEGFSIFRQLSATQPEAIGVAATVMGSDSAIVSALSAGAQGYLLKSDPEDLLKKHLTQILDGIPPLSPAIARRVMAHFRRTGPNTDIGDTLSKRETEVLAYIGKGLRVSDTADALQVAESTVSTHVKSIYRKLNISSRAEASIEAARMGLSVSHQEDLG